MTSVSVRPQQAVPATASSLHVLVAAGASPTPNSAQQLAADARAAGHVITLVLAAAGPRPAFRKVNAALTDSLHEHQLAAAIRADRPDVVHVLGCGAETSIHLSWIARAMGVPCALEVSAAALRCHRGDLVYADGSPCRQSDDPARCAACCHVRTPGRDSLSKLGATLARATRWLGDVSPFPTALTFRNRTDLLASALNEASAIVVRDQAAREAALELGAPGAKVRLVDGLLLDELLNLWRSLGSAR